MSSLKQVQERPQELESTLTDFNKVNEFNSTLPSFKSKNSIKTPNQKNAPDIYQKQLRQGHKTLGSNSKLNKTHYNHHDSRQTLAPLIDKSAHL